MKRLLIALAAGSLMFAGAAMAQSAKFAAVWSDEAKVIVAYADAACDNATDPDTDGCRDFESDNNAGYTMATIRVPKGKEILAGVSAQVGMFTKTRVKGKRGSYSYARALTSGAVALFACPTGTYDSTAEPDCTMGEPGMVTLNMREQTLEAVLGGIIESCIFDVELDVIDDVATGDATFDLGDCTVADESISLALSTMDASHFNFVFPDMDGGDFDIVAVFYTAAEAEAYASCLKTYGTNGTDGTDTGSIYCLNENNNETGADGGSVDGGAEAVAEAFIGKTMLTLQEVRAVKGELSSRTITEIGQ